MPKRVLMMTYEFPPSGGGGVQRMAKFARYLPEAGWEPLVVCARPVHGRPTDPTLAEEVAGIEVVRTPARNPTAAIARVLAPLKLIRRSRTASAPVPASGPTAETAEPLPASSAAAPPVGGSRPPRSASIARRFTMDDAELWTGPAVRAAVREGRRAGVSAVVASGPPFSVLVAGARVARELGVPFIADMRDAWRDNPSAYYPRPEDREKALRLERAVVSAADVVLGVSAPIVDEAVELGARDARLLPNGFDSADLVLATPSTLPGLRLAFMGKIYRGHSDPWHLLEAIARLVATAPDLDIRLDLIGGADQHVASHVDALGLGDRVTLHGYLPHKQAAALAATADVGLVLIADVPGAKASVTGKLFEYLGMGLPVLVLGPTDGEAAKLVASSQAGWCVQPDDLDGIVGILRRLAQTKAEGEPLLHGNRASVDAYERRALAAKLATFLSEVSAR